MSLSYKTALRKKLRLIFIAIRRKLFPVDVQKMREFYKNTGSLGIVSLIEYLISTGPECREMGSSSIVLDDWVDEPLTRFIKTNGLYIGSRDGSLTPLEWLDKFSTVFLHVSEPTRNRFDKVCGEFAKVCTDLNKGDFEEVSFDVV